MRASIHRLLILGVVISFPILHASSNVFLEPAWRNELPADGIAIWAGGNVSSVESAPRSETGILLLESAIGQITSPLAYPGASEDLRSVAVKSRLEASPYRLLKEPFGIRTNPAVAWQLIFPGGFDPVNGTTYSGADPRTSFFPGKLDEAEYALRAVLRINPLDRDAARLFLAIVQEQMLPLEYSGSLATTYAAKSRLQGAGVTLKEIPAVSLARSYFKNACDQFGEVLDNPADAALLEGLSPVSSVATDEVFKLLDAYLRCLNRYAQTTLLEFRLRNFADFRDPAQQQVPSLGLLNEIDAALAEISIRLIKASAIPRLPDYVVSQVGRVNSHLHELGQLHDSIVRGRVTFISGAVSESSSNPLRRYGSYDSYFVPIFSGDAGAGPATGNSSFDRAIGLAMSFAGFAQSLESTAKTEVEKVLLRQYEYRKEQLILEQQYLGELVTLCGSIPDEVGDPVPDVYFGALPPEVRETVGNQFVKNNYFLPPPNQLGAIWQQWQVLAQSETNLALASLELQNTLVAMEVRQRVAEEIAAGQESIAALILTNGQKVSGLEIKAGEINAEAALQSARIQARAAKKKGIISGVVGTLTGIASFAATGNPSGLVDSASAMAQTYVDISQIRSLGELGAQTGRQLAQIQAQITQISAAERAAMQYESANETMLRLSEALNDLRLQADAQRIRIRLADQQVEQEESKLATLLARVAFLLREWSRSVMVANQNPQLSDDLLLERADVLQQADDAFVLAQQWAFLAAQAYSYKDNWSTLPSRFVPQVLKARNAIQLQLVLNEVVNANAQLPIIYQNSATFNRPRFSIRNDFYQKNVTQGEGTNTLYLNYAPTLLGSGGEASNREWLSFLQGSLATNGATVYLKLRFSTSLLANWSRNQLWSCDRFGDQFSSVDQTGVSVPCVQISFTTTGLTLPGDSLIDVRLAQLGMSSVRRRGYANPDAGLRYYNFAPFLVAFKASLNNLKGNPGTVGFVERSPSNDLWELIVAGDTDANRVLLANLDRISDIELRFSTRGFVDFTASQICFP